MVGAPNVGKSTLINRISGKNSLKTGNRAGVTKGISWVRISNTIELMDTPGILYPKIESDTLMFYFLGNLFPVEYGFEYTGIMNNYLLISSNEKTFIEIINTFQFYKNSLLFY